MMRVLAFYGYGAGSAELVLRPRLALRLILWPLLPWSAYCRVELRGHTLTSFGHPTNRSPVRLGDSTIFRLERDLRFDSRNYYRVLTIEDLDSGGRIRLAVVVWSRWRRLAAVVDPENALDLVDDPSRRTQ